MENKRRNAYDAAFKLKAVNLAVKEGNRAAARGLGINESMVRRWKRQREELSQCKKSKKAFRGNKSRWPELEDFLEDWVNTQRADGRGVSTVQIRLKAKTVTTEMRWTILVFQIYETKGTVHQGADDFVTATPSLPQGKNNKLRRIHTKKDRGIFHRTGPDHKYG